MTSAQEARKGMLHLRTLDLAGKTITDAGIAHLKGLTQLESLNLADCNGITDAGIAQLKGLTQLQF